MKTFLVVFGVLFAFITALFFGCMQLDLLVNGNWLRVAAAEATWWNVLTMGDHAPTVMYIKGSWAWLIGPFLVSLFVSLGLTAVIKSS